MTRTIRMKDITGLKANATTAPFVTTEPTKIGGVRGGGSTPPSGNGALIFDADFDNVADWEIDHASQRYRYPGDAANDGASGYIAQDNIPPNWDFYYTSEKWHPNGDKNGDGAVVGSESMAAITSRHGSHLGSSTGKALVMYDESYGGSSQWGSDCVLIKELPTEYDEIVLDFYLKFEPNFVFEDEINGSGQTAFKLIRFGRSHAGPADNRFSFFGAGPYNHWYIFSLKSWTDGTNVYSRIKHSIILNPWGSAPSYEGNAEQGFANDDGQPPQVFNDGQWHKWRIRAKMNTQAGVADGELQLWMDDIQQHLANDIEWNTDPNDNGSGFNVVSVGGNSSNVPYPEVDQYEQWIAISGVKLYNGLPA